LNQKKIKSSTSAIIEPQSVWERTNNNPELPTVHRSMNYICYGCLKKTNIDSSQVDFNVINGFNIHHCNKFNNCYYVECNSSKIEILKLIPFFIHSTANTQSSQFPKSYVSLISMVDIYKC